MTVYYILQHYVDGVLVGVWIEGLPEPISRYDMPRLKDKLRAKLTTLDRRWDESWKDHWEKVAEYLPASRDRFVLDSITAPIPPQPDMVFSMVKLEDARLRGRQAL